MSLVSIPVILMSGISAYVGFYHLWMYVRLRQNKENLSFALLCFSITLYDFFCAGLYNAASIQEGMYWQRGQFFTMGYAVIAVLKFAHDFTGLGFRKVLPVVSVIVVLFSGSVFFESEYTLTLAAPNDRIVDFFGFPVPYHEVYPGLLFEAFYTILGASMIYCYVLFIRVLIKDRDKKIIPLIVAMTIFFIAIFNDMGVSENEVPFIYTTEYAFIFLILSMAYTLLNRFVDLHNRVELMNVELEDKVRERTRELERAMVRTTEMNKDLEVSLEESQKLRTQQDGDYFLISLLTEPLAGRNIPGNLVDVEMVVKQKKEFSFRNRDHEIGGDLCNADQIRLRDKNYTVFVNGDAMGKSIQGAGGAIVLGVVYKSILNRSQQLIELRKSPEHWLQDAYQEFQKTFITFEGSMLVSFVLGLLDEETGMLYYINAEHPYTILYRDKKASFLEDDLHLRKLGVESNHEHFSIKTFRLQDTDILLLGSDGRDDLSMGVDDRGNRIINEDAEMILEKVNNNAADLGRLVKDLAGDDRLTDDLSFIRIAYKEDYYDPSKHPVLVERPAFSGAGSAQEAESEIPGLEAYLRRTPEDSVVAEELVRLALLTQNYELIGRFSERCSELIPWEEKYLLYTSRALMKADRLTRRTVDRAILFSERFFLRNPAHIENARHLHRLYRLNTRPQDQKDMLLNLERFLEDNQDHTELKALVEELGQSAEI